MKILIVGGTGLIGGHAALLLRQKGHEVSLASRKPVAADSPLAAFPVLSADYLTGDITREALSRFDTLVFAAGSDPRHIKDATIDEEEHWRKTNIEGVPRFFAAARDAGIKRAINIGSFYPQAAPETIERNAYVRSRFKADEGVRALNREGFAVCSLNPPFMVGMTPGDPRPKSFIYVRYAMGLSKTPLFAIPGGVNYMSVRSLAEAIAGAVERGEPGKPYLIGDQNLSFQEYLGEYCRAVGRDELPEVRDEANPLMPPSIGGPGVSLFFETDPADAQRLGYRRNDIRPMVTEMVAAYRAQQAAEQAGGGKVPS